MVSQFIRIRTISTKWDVRKQMGCTHIHVSLPLPLSSLSLSFSVCVCAFDRIKVLSVNEKVINFILPLNRGLPNKSLFLSLSSIFLPLFVLPNFYFHMRSVCEEYLLLAIFILSHDSTHTVCLVCMYRHPTMFVTNKCVA